MIRWPRDAVARWQAGRRAKATALPEPARREQRRRVQPPTVHDQHQHYLSEIERHRLNQAPAVEAPQINIPKGLPDD